MAPHEQVTPAGKAEQPVGGGGATDGEGAQRRFATARAISAGPSPKALAGEEAAGIAQTMAARAEGRKAHPVAPKIR